MGKYDETVCCCALNRVFGFRPEAAKALIENLGSASAVFELPGNELFRILGPFRARAENLNEPCLAREEKELEKLRGNGFDFIGYTDPCFPERLKECPDAPAGLYVAARTPKEKLFRGRYALSVVGTRNMTPYGREWCGRIVESIARQAPETVIISGLAFGIDITAHAAALRSGLSTIAVMATGIEQVYPFRHRDTAAAISEREGCALVTDYPPGTVPAAVNFLRRNRIIAGLSSATVIVESKIRGGGMTTARLAFSYDRDVYALPGKIDDEMSQGCNLLIQEGVAEAVVSAETLIKSLGLGSGRCRGGIAEKASAGYTAPNGTYDTGTVSKILEAIARNRGITLERLAAVTGCDSRTVARTAGLLEIDGLITVDLMQRCSINPK